MDERLQFVARRLAGEPMEELCREFGLGGRARSVLFEVNRGPPARSSSLRHL